MKKFFLSILLTIILLPLHTKALQISAESAILIDANSKRVLYSKNASEVKLIASTTKIMTAIIALEHGNLDDIITVNDEVLKAYGSAIYIEIGEQLTLRDLLYGLMLRSGNDAAIVIANYIGENQENFVNMMNQKALELNMNNTTFYNPHGLEEDDKANTSTAYDMALLMQYAMQNKNFKSITSTKSYTLKTNKKSYIWKNKNKLLTTYEYATGGKTGYTQKARRTLVTTATKDNKNLIVVTLNDPNDFQDHQNLYEEYFAKYDLVTLVDHNDYQTTDKKYSNKILYIKEDIKILLTKEEKKKVKLEEKIIEPDKYQNNNIAGTINVILNDEIIVSQNIYYKDKQVSKSLWDKIKSWFS